MQVLFRLCNNGLYICPVNLSEYALLQLSRKSDVILFAYPGWFCVSGTDAGSWKPVTNVMDEYI